MAAAGKAAFEQGVIACVPGPGMSLGQLSQQAIGWGPCYQQRALEQLCLAEQHFTARVHGRRLRKIAQCSRAALAPQPTTRHACPAKYAWAFSASWPTIRWRASTAPQAL